MFAAVAALVLCLPFVGAMADEFSEPWRKRDRALVLDGYEYNIFDLTEIAGDKRIVGFIHKGSDGLWPEYSCKGSRDNTEHELCRKTWQRYAVSRELYLTRRMLAKALGLKWGAYHLGRPGNPEEQARHFLDYADPQPDELIAIDIEDNKPEKFMSLKEAERFAIYINKRLDRWPVLYTNGSTALHIARNRDEYPVLSRLRLWYARYKPQIGDHFPKGNWQGYDLWQFAYHGNCNKSRCPYRVKGAGRDIDVNVAAMSVDELRAAWPLEGLVDDLRPTPEAETLVAENGPAPGSVVALAGQWSSSGTAELAARAADRAIEHRRYAFANRRLPAGPLEMPPQPVLIVADAVSHAASPVTDRLVERRQLASLNDEIDHDDGVVLIDLAPTSAIAAN